MFWLTDENLEAETLKGTEIFYTEDCKCSDSTETPSGGRQWVTSDTQGGIATSDETDPNMSAEAGEYLCSFLNLKTFPHCQF